MKNPIGLVLAAALALGAYAPGRCLAKSPIPENPDTSQCDNCTEFPKEWLRADPKALIDFGALPPERRLDFLIGEWELYFPDDVPEKRPYFTRDMPIGYEIFKWFVPKRIIEGFQEWPFTAGGGRPFRARTDFRYIAKEDRWQMTWITGGSTGFYTGGYLGHGTFGFHDFEPVGDRQQLSLRPGMRYVFRNITQDQFVAEEWRSADGGKTYTILKWQLLYRRRRN